MRELVPALEVLSDGTPLSIEGRNSLDTFGVWTVCAYVSDGPSAFSDPLVYAVGTINVTEACTGAQTSITRASAAVRSARKVLRRARSARARARARTLLRKRQRQLTAAIKGHPALLARDCPEG